MKTLRNIAAALLVVLSASAFASDISPASKARMNVTLNTFIDAVCKGQIKGVTKILDSSVKYTVSNGNKITTMNKTDLLDYFRQIENIEQNCKASYDLLESNETQAIVKLKLKYAEFSKNNVLTMNYTDKGWIITNISVSFDHE